MITVGLGTIGRALSAAFHAVGAQVTVLDQLGGAALDGISWPGLEVRDLSSEFPGSLGLMMHCGGTGMTRAPIDPARGAALAATRDAYLPVALNCHSAVALNLPAFRMLDCSENLVADAWLSPLGKFGARGKKETLQ